jgi:flagellar biosynthetic protein FlhB
VSSGEEKTEKPTAKKRKESRKEGQVPRTQELGAWAAMLLAGLAMPTMISREVDAIQGLMIACLRTLEDPTASDALQLLGQGAGHAFKALLLLGAAVMVVGVAAALAQGGFFLATKTVQPKLSKLDPIKGAKRIFGIQALWEGAKMLLKCALVAVLVKATVTSMMPLLGGMVPVGFLLHQTGDEALALIRNVAIAGLVMAGADYAMTRRRIGKQTRMTKEEVKQEHKQQEGDPMLKGAIRSRQLAMARSRMMADVLAADVVLVNPTHVAVALRYDPEAGAPTVVARGAGAIAARIRELAGENDVPLVQDVPLARALYSSTEVGQEIPAELFAAVAQVLAFVISRRNAGRGGGSHRSPRPETELGPVPVAGRRRRIPSGPALAAR